MMNSMYSYFSDTALHFLFLLLIKFCIKTVLKYYADTFLCIRLFLLWDDSLFFERLMSNLRLSRRSILTLDTPSLIVTLVMLFAQVPETMCNTYL